MYEVNFCLWYKLYIGSGVMNLNRLKELREDNDLLQKDVAKALGISQRNYSYIETGKTVLTEDLLRKLASYYETSIDYLLYLTDERLPYPPSIVGEDVNPKKDNVRKRNGITFHVWTL